MTYRGELCGCWLYGGEAPNEYCSIHSFKLVEQKIRSCNRHSDCSLAEFEYVQKYGNSPRNNFHCHDEYCEDCFGQ